MNPFDSINLWAVLVAAASAFALGGLWYGPLFLKPWAHASGMDPAAAPSHPVRIFALAFACSLAAAAAFAFVLPPGATALTGSAAGALVGVFFVATSFGINYAFSRRSLLLWLIDAGYHVVQFVLYGAIIGAWR